MTLININIIFFLFVSIFIIIFDFIMVLLTLAASAVYICVCVKRGGCDNLLTSLLFHFLFSANKHRERRERSFRLSPLCLFHTQTHTNSVISGQRRRISNVVAERDSRNLIFKHFTSGSCTTVDVCVSVVLWKLRRGLFSFLAPPKLIEI